PAGSPPLPCALSSPLLLPLEPKDRTDRAEDPIGDSALPCSGQAAERATSRFGRSLGAAAPRGASLHHVSAPGGLPPPARLPGRFPARSRRREGARPSGSGRFGARTVLRGRRSGSH